MTPLTPALWALPADPAFGADLYVCQVPGSCSLDMECTAAKKAGACFNTVQAPIDAAADGDVIYLSDETYVESLSNDGGPSPLTFQGAVCPGTTTIMGDSGAEGIDFDDVDSTWRDLTITDGDTNRHGAKFVGGSISMERVTVAGCIANHGGGIDLDGDAHLVLTDSVFVDNHALNEGGAINLHSGTVEANGTRFLQGVADGAVGGAFRILEGSVTIERGVLEGNEADEGGAIYATGNTELTVRASRLSGNRAMVDNDSKGGAIYATGNTELDVDNAWFEANQADGHGGAIYCLGGSMSCSVRRSTFVDNVGDFGGAVAFQSVPNGSVEQSLICRNMDQPGSLSEGAGVMASAGAPDLTNNTSSWKTTTTARGALCTPPMAR